MTAKFVPTMLSDDWQIVIAESLHDTPTGIRASFVGGRVAILSRINPEWSGIREWLTFSLRARCPIAVVFTTDDEMAHAGMIDCNAVAEVADNKRLAHVLDVTFEGAPAPRCLDKNAPRYPELRRLVDHSLTQTKDLWCVIQGCTIVAARFLSPEEDEALGRWIQEHGQGAA
jgi:hypothetical protein